MEKILIRIDQPHGKSGFGLQANLDLEQGQLYMLLGPSGSGKSTFLRTLAGLTRTPNEQIRFGQTHWSDKKSGQFIQPGVRGVRMVFQSYVLFPNMTVQENIKIAQKLGRGREIPESLIHILDLGDLLNRKPAQLSAGQKQRAAIACALVDPPLVLLLDEPLSVLDRASKQRFRNYIQEYRRTHGVTIFWASHDPDDLPNDDYKVIEMSAGKAKLREDKGIHYPISLKLVRKVKGGVQLEMNERDWTLLSASEKVRMRVDGEERLIRFVDSPEGNHQ